MLEPLATTLIPPLLDRAVLVVNHVLRLQPQACERLAAHAGRSIDIAWLAPAGPWPVPPTVRVLVTPAGMVERDVGSNPALAAEAASLNVRIELPTPLRLVTMSMAGERPHVEVDGDARFAADVAWLADNLRWDAEHDLARLVGDAPARLLTESAKAAVRGLRGMAQGIANTWDRRTGGAGTASPR